eukprot:TRINITY_DN735_c0_g1_i1.p1 TRINITY_DN735_c0_g1~~TRINITY_DN735_c0_g1_i1.p1  ORF type:complete len:1397 (+),score=453.90 TRINITY_DN735_c0_g1_i1:9191-13381(+)
MDESGNSAASRRICSERGKVMAPPKPRCRPSSMKVSACWKLPLKAWAMPPGTRMRRRCLRMMSCERRTCSNTGKSNSRASLSCSAKKNSCFSRSGGSFRAGTKKSRPISPMPTNRGSAMAEPTASRSRTRSVSLAVGTQSGWMPSAQTALPTLRANCATSLKLTRAMAGMTMTRTPACAASSARLAERSPNSPASRWQCVSTHMCWLVWRKSEDRIITAPVPDDDARNGGLLPWFSLACFPRSVLFFYTAFGQHIRFGPDSNVAVYSLTGPCNYQQTQRLSLQRPRKRTHACVLLQDGRNQGSGDLQRLAQLAQELLAALHLRQRHELVGLVGVANIAGAADDGGDADLLEQAGLGAIGHLAGLAVTGERAHQLGHGGLLGRFQRRAAGEVVDLDAGLGEFGTHLRQQGLGDVLVDLCLDVGHAHARQVAEFIGEFAQLGDGVDRDAATDLVGGHGAERHIEELVVGAIGLVAIGEVADGADQAGRVLDGIAALRGQRGVGRLAMHLAGEHVDALVGHHHVHAGGFAHHAAIDLDAALDDLFQHHRRADAADFLVIGKRQVDGLGTRHGQEFRHQRQRSGDETLHVAGTATVQAAILLGDLEGIGIPLLAVHRHHVGVTGEDDATLGAASQGTSGGRQSGEQVGLGLFLVVGEPGGDALLFQAVAHRGDQLQVGIAAGGIKGDQGLQPLAGVHVLVLRCSKAHRRLFWRRRRETASLPGLRQSCCKPCSDRRRSRPQRPASSLSWVTMTKAVPRVRDSSIISSKVLSAVPRSRLPVGSSASTQAGRVTSARASATRWRSPPESSPGTCVTRCARPTCSSISRACACASARLTRRIISGMATLSSAENSGNRWWNWQTKPSDWLRKLPRSRSPRLAKSLPSRVTLPLLGVSSPPSRCSSVDLPEPDAPTMATCSPGWTSISTLPSTFTEYLPCVKVLPRPRAASTIFLSFIVFMASLIAQRLRRFDAGGRPARVERRQEGQHHGHATDGIDVGPDQVGRQLGNHIHALGQELHVEQALDGRHHHIDVQRHQHAQADADGRADQAHQGALDHEDLHDRPRRRPQGAQDGNVGLLVGDRHDQRGDQVEGGHGDDEGQDDEHHALLGLDRREPVAVLLRPVAQVEVTGQGTGQLLGHLRRLQHVADAQAHAGGRVLAEQGFGILHLDEGQRGIELVVTSLEDARHGELLQARQHARRGHLPLRRDQGDLVAQAHAQAARQLATDDDIEFTGLERIETALLDLLGHIRDLGFFLGHDTAHHHAAQGVVARDHGLCRHVGGRAQHFLVLEGLFGHRLPIMHGAGSVEHLDMRQHREHAVADFLLEAVHDREHHDQRGHAQRDAGHGNEGNEGNEAIAAAALAGPRIADTDQPFERQVFNQTQKLLREWAWRSTADHVTETRS